MVTPPTQAPIRRRLSRAQVHTAFYKIEHRLTPAVRRLAEQLLSLLDDTGSASVKAVHDTLFPLASTASASAQLSRLLKSLGAAADASLVVWAPKFVGAKQAGVSTRQLYFEGLASTPVAHTEGLDAIAPAQLIDGQRAVPFVTEKRLVLLTFNDHEFRAVQRAFVSMGCPDPITIEGLQFIPLGQHAGLEVLLRHSAQGSVQSQRSASDVFNAAKPLAIIAVGIAFGIDETKQKIGDVLLSNYVCGYELAKVHADGRMTLRGARPPASKRLLDVARLLDQAQRNGPQRGTWPLLRFGGILSGDKLLDNLDYREALKRAAGQDDIVGGEMEGTGLHAALEGRPADWIIVKAICDFGDGHKGHGKEQRQQDAAENAAQVVHTIVSSGLLYPGDSNTAPPRTASGPRRLLAPYLAEAADSGVLVHSRAQAVDLASARIESASGGRPSVVALDDILEWACAQGDVPPLYALLGEYGMGKTTTSQRVAKELQRRRDAGNAVPEPLYFDLRHVKSLMAANENRNSPGKVPTLREVIEDCLTHGYLHEAGEAPRYDEVLAALRRGAVVIFDGLDEVLARLDDRQGSGFTANLLRILPEAAQQGAPAPRLLLSCRTQFFRTLAEQNNHLTGEHRGAQPASRFRAMLLLPFEDDQILAYLGAAFPNGDASQLLARIGEIHNLRELAGRPFTLKLVSRFIPRLEQWRAQGRTVTGATLYREVARDWLIRDKAKQSFQPEDKEQLAADLAAHLWRQSERGVTANELERWLGAWLAEQDPHADFQLKPRDLLQEDLRNSTFLKRVDGEGLNNSRFEFAHTSLLEFFLAEHLLRTLRRNVRAGWALPRPSVETLDFLGQLLAEDPLPLANLQRWRRPYLAQASEMQLAYGLRAAVQGWPMTTLEGMDLSGADLTGWYFGIRDEAEDTAPPLSLRGANFSGARLRQSHFWRADLRDANFEGCALSQAEFLNCWLEGARWQDAGLEGTVFRPSSPHQPLTSQRAAPGARLALVRGHQLQIGACSFSPDGRRIASGADDKTVRLWDATTGELLRVFAGRGEPVLACAFSPDGRRIASGTENGIVYVWDATSGQLLSTFTRSERAIMACTFSADGRQVITGGDTAVHVWNADDGTLLRVLQGQEKTVTACACSPNGRWIVSGSSDTTLYVWDIARGEVQHVLAGHVDWIRCCAFSPDSRRVVSGSDDFTLRVWDAASGTLLRVLEGHEDWVHACQFSPDGSRIISCADDATIRVWDADNGELLHVASEGGYWVNAWAISPDGRWAVSGGSDNTLRVRDVASGELTRVLQGHEVEGYGCTFSPDGRAIAWVDSAENLRLCAASTGELLRVLTGHGASVHASAFSADGRLVASSADDDTIGLWDAASGELLRILSGHEDSVNTCAFSPDGCLIVSGSDDGTLRIWDVASGTTLRVLSGHADWVNACVFSSDGRRIASCADDGTLRLWDAHTGKMQHVLPGHEGATLACAFSPDGRHVITGSSDKTLRIWNAARGKMLRILSGHDASILACAVSPDGQRIISGCRDHSLRIWNAKDGKSLHVLAGHEGPVLNCAFSTDGREIISGARDNTVRFWDSASGELLRIHAAVDRGSAAWMPATNRLLHANGRIWRSLRWIGFDQAAGELRSWPLECPPLGHGETKVVRWSGSGTTQDPTRSPGSKLSGGLPLTHRHRGA